MKEARKVPPTEGWGRFVLKALIDLEETLKEASDSAKSKGSGVRKVLLVLSIVLALSVFLTWAMLVHPEWNLESGR